MASKGMVQVFGTTYRIVSGAELYYVFRLLDDAAIGCFRHRPALEIVDSNVERSRLLEIAKAAQRQGRLEWTRTQCPACRGGNSWIRRLVRQLTLRPISALDRVMLGPETG